MKALNATFHELIGLFVEDGSLALQIAGVVVLAGVFALLLPNNPAPAGGVLLFGCLLALAVNVASAARR